MQNLSNIYIGKIIQQHVDEMGLCYADFARRIHVARTSLYRIFESKSIDIERLLLISEVLGVDLIHTVYLAGSERNVAGGSPILPPPSVSAREPALVLPIRRGQVVLDGLPRPLLEMLREALNGLND